MKVLGERYAKQFPGWALEIRSLCEKLREDERDREALDALYRLVHGLAGSGATFGFTRLSEAAKACEVLLLDCMNSGRLNRDELKARLDPVLCALEE